MNTADEIVDFQADATELLNLLIHSVYPSKDIFLELISNALDAIGRLHIESLTNASLLQVLRPPEIRLSIDRLARTLIIADNSIGMSRDDVIANIGTLAKSGTRVFRQWLATSDSQKFEIMIGQFGVGFTRSSWWRRE